MTFDIVIGNPPYNNDMYLNFIIGLMQIYNKYMCMITPAKWQSKNKGDNADFRQNVVPYMSHIVMYRNSHDVFDVDDNAGISYYLIGKERLSERLIKNICINNDSLNSDFEIHDEDKVTLYNRNILKIIGKAGTLGWSKQSMYVSNTDYGEMSKAGTLGWIKQSMYVSNTDYGEMSIAGTLGFRRQTYIGEQDKGVPITIEDNYVEVVQGEEVCGYKRKEELFTTLNLDKYKCTCSCMMGYSAMFGKSDKIIGSPYINILKPNQVPKGSFIVLRYFDTLGEAKSFQMYMHTKFISFLFFLGICGATINSEFFRYIPEQKSYDNIYYEDKPLPNYTPDPETGEYDAIHHDKDNNPVTIRHCSLYVKYHLTEDEINIIESVIKARK